VQRGVNENELNASGLRTMVGAARTDLGVPGGDEVRVEGALQLAAHAREHLLGSASARPAPRRCCNASSEGWQISEGRRATQF